MPMPTRLPLLVRPLSTSRRPPRVSFQMTEVERRRRSSSLHTDALYLAFALTSQPSKPIDRNRKEGSERLR